jgi:adenosylcobinamide-phosphate synthase
VHISLFTFALAAAAVGLEALFGYPAWLFAKIGHPVTWMGRLIAALDRSLNRDANPPGLRRAAGFAAILVLLLVTSFATQLLSTAIWGLFGPGVFGLLPTALCASSCVAQRSLAEHVRDVAHALEGGDIEAGRRAVARIVGRDVALLDRGGISRAAIESLAENFADGIVAPAFWLAILGPLGGFLYKAVNTADSMIGHRTQRHCAFGFAAAKLDDLVNIMPARLAALWLLLAAERMQKAGAWRTIQRDAHGHPSPNAGWPEAAIAGALGVKLGGPRSYAARRVEDRWIGEGRSDLSALDITRALQVYRRACAINFAALVLAALVSFLVIGRG